MGTTIGIVAIKGGVGKTTIAASLAADLAHNYQKSVLLIDANFSAPNLGLHTSILNPERTIHHVLDKKISMRGAVHSKFGMDIIPGNFAYNSKIDYLKLKDYIKKIKSDYDFVIIDSSPNSHDEILSTIIAADSLFMITTPDYPTISCSLKTAKLAKQRGHPVEGIIINKVRDPRYEINTEAIERATGIPVIAKISDDKEAVRALFYHLPVTLYNKNSSISREINKINSALTNTPEKRSFMKSIFALPLNREEVNRSILKEDFYTSYFSDK